MKSWGNQVESLRTTDLYDSIILSYAMVTEVARASHKVLRRNSRELNTFYVHFSHYVHSLLLDLVLLNCGVGEDS